MIDTLYWGAVSGAVGYVIIYKPVNSLSAFTTVTTSSNSIAISGLTSGTSYIYQVRAICANGTTTTNMSPLSSPYVFTTLNALVVFPNPANEKLNIHYNNNLYTNYSISDLAGKVIISNTINQLDDVIDISSLQKGLYLFSAKGAKNYIQKIVVE